MSLFLTQFYYIYLYVYFYMSTSIWIIELYSFEDCFLLVWKPFNFHRNFRIRLSKTIFYKICIYDLIMITCTSDWGRMAIIAIRSPPTYMYRMAIQFYWALISFNIVLFQFSLDIQACTFNHWATLQPLLDIVCSLFLSTLFSSALVEMQSFPYFIFRLFITIVWKLAGFKIMILYSVIFLNLF